MKKRTLRNMIIKTSYQKMLVLLCVLCCLELHLIDISYVFFIDTYAAEVYKKNINEEKEIISNEKYVEISKMINTIKTVSELRNDIKNGQSADTILLGSYQQAKMSDKKPIEWYVLEKNDNKAILLSKYILDLKVFNTKEIRVDKDGNMIAELYKWLDNVFFIDSFDNNEKLLIDKKEGQFVHLIKRNEIDKYFYIDGKYYDNCTCTEYADKKGENMETNTDAYWIGVDYDTVLPQLKIPEYKMHLAKKMYENVYRSNASIFYQNVSESVSYDSIFGVRPLIVVKYDPNIR